RGRLQRGGQRRRPHAPPRARRRAAHRPHHRRPRLLHLGRLLGHAKAGFLMSAPRHTRPGPDTVERAAATPDTPQPWAELGLKEDEYRRIREILGRRPTGAALAMYSVMWSEHCSYKSSK